MTISRPVLAGLGALLAAAVPATTVAAAHAAAPSPVPSRITVSTADHDVAVGEEFVLRGRFVADGRPVAGVPVKVRTYRSGGWVDLAGATVRTDREGRYRVRLVLHQDGDRDLRVVGNPAGGSIATARRETVVRVWR